MRNICEYVSGRWIIYEITRFDSVSVMGRRKNLTYLAKFAFLCVLFDRIVRFIRSNLILFPVRNKDTVTCQFSSVDSS
jgi:hypothetical protein